MFFTKKQGNDDTKYIEKYITHQGTKLYTICHMSYIYMYVYIYIYMFLTWGTSNKEIKLVQTCSL